MRKLLALISVVVGAITSCVAVVVSLAFFRFPRGAEIRPLGWVWEMMLVAGFALVFGALPALFALRVPTRRLAVAGLLLSLLPYPAAVLTLWLASALCGFTLSS